MLLPRSTPLFLVVRLVFWIFSLMLMTLAATGWAQDCPKLPDAAIRTVPTHDGIRDDLKRLQGTWNCTYVECMRKEMPNNVSPTDEALVAPMIQGHFWIESGEFSKNTEPYGEIKLNPSTEPKQIDIIRSDRAEVLAGIYKINGDTLTICLTIDRFTPIRPTRFATKEDIPVALFVYKKK